MAEFDVDEVISSGKYDLVLPDEAQNFLSGLGVTGLA